MKRSTKFSILYASELPVDLAIWLHLSDITIPIFTKITIGVSTLFITIFTLFLVMTALVESN